MRRSNVNDRFRHSRTERVTWQQMKKVQGLTTPSREVVAAQEIEATALAAGEKRQAQHILRELMRVKPIMDARHDKRRRPPGVSTAAFKMYSKLWPSSKKKKKKHRPAKK